MDINTENLEIKTTGQLIKITEELDREKMVHAMTAYYELTSLANWLKAYIADNPTGFLCDRFRKAVKISDDCYAKLKSMQEIDRRIHNAILDKFEADQEPFG